MCQRRDGRGGAPTGQLRPNYPREVTSSFAPPRRASGLWPCGQQAWCRGRRALRASLLLTLTSRRTVRLAHRRDRPPALTAALTRASVVPMLNASRTLIVRPHRYRSGLQDHLALLHLSAPNGTGFICTHSGRLPPCCAMRRALLYRDDVER